MKNRASIVGFSFRSSFLPFPGEPVSGANKVLHELRFAPDRTVPNWYSWPKKFFPVRADRPRFFGARGVRFLETDRLVASETSLLLAGGRLLDEWCRGLGARFRLEPKHRRELSPNGLSDKEGHIDPCPGDGLGDGQAQTGPVVAFN
jgi:hypothetical protein